MSDRSNRPRSIGSLGRRSALGGLAGALLWGAGVQPSIASDGGQPTGSQRASHEQQATHADTHHPGPPRFVQVGEPVSNPVHVGEHGAFGFRDNITPRLPAFEPDADGFDPEAFEWSIVDQPEGSDASLQFGHSTDEEFPRYDPGTEHTVDFEADEPGRYVLELDAPDGTHQLTVHAFPAGDGPPPLCTLSGSADGSTFEIEADARTAPESDAADVDIDVVFLADDRDALDTEDIEQSADGLTATVPVDALDGETARLHACAFDGNARSAIDTIELTPDGTVESPNRPPEWVKNGVIYQIFPRSWVGERRATTMDDLVDGVDYLDEIGVDAVWLTPVVPAESVARQFGLDGLAPEYDYLSETLSGGGPHGYDTLDYFGISPDLVPDGADPIESYRRFVDACHDADIKVVFDIVISHCGRSHEFFQDTIAEQGSSPPDPELEYPPVTAWDEDSPRFDRFARVATDDSFDGELVEVSPHNTGFFGLRHMPNFNYSSLAARSHMLAVADFWSGEIGVDGFRCDIAWGVPRSMWSEIREVVRENNAEFLMLDETIPKDYRMSENAFGMHFDTEGFTVSAHDVATGDADPELLVDDVRDRANQGIPGHNLVLNLIENHDEHRLLNQAVLDVEDPDRESVTDEEWEEAAHLQRACWATGVFLPGVPGVYYGQERQISRFGEGRHLGADDHRGVDADGNPDQSADIRPDGRQRAFMNWDEYPEEHLAFYERLIEVYHELDVLKPDADLVPAWSFSNDDVVAFGRDASNLSDVAGPEQVLAIVNFESTPSEVTVRPEIGTRDLITGRQLSDEDDVRPGTVLTVDDVLLLEAPTLYGVGEQIADFAPPEGTDHGPGSYEYPTDDSIPDGAFDVEEFSIHETTDQYQFRLSVAGDLTNPAEREHGFSHQHLQVYVRDPSREDGSTAAREGVNAAFDAPYQYRVVVDGDHGVRIEKESGDELSIGTVTVNSVTDELLVEVPKAAFGGSMQAFELSPLLLGYDPDAPGNVLPVEESPGPDSFGGAAGENPTQIIDTGLPPTFPNETALEGGETGDATVPFTGVRTPFEELATFNLDTGLGYGPGTYDVPTGDAYYEEAWDIDQITISESRDDVRIEYTMATEPENPWDFGTGFSHPFFQVYIRSPGADPATASGREGTNVGFLDAYHYRVVVHGEGVETIENAAGETVSREVSVTTEGRTVTIEFPRPAVNWTTEAEGVAVAPTVVPYDGFGDGGVRGISPDAGEHAIGGGHTAAVDPAVMDMAVPDGMDRQTVLEAYDEDTPARLPFIGLGSHDDIVELQFDIDEAEDDTTDESDDSEAATGDDSIPGFGVAGALSGLGGAAYLLRRRLGDAETDG